jgi:membrane protease YdiL (CAAX protease family)
LEIIMVSKPAPPAAAILDGGLQQHTLLLSIALHLVPGVLGTVFYVLSAPMAMRLGFPPLLAIYSAIVVIIAFELGYLLAQGKQHTGRLSLPGVMLEQARLPARQYAVWVPLVVVWAILASGLLAPLDMLVAHALFAWLPDWYLFADVPHYAALYTHSALILTLVVGLVLNGIAGPLVEELYFRGYLLPRLARFGHWAPLINVVLFSLYHFWSPWQFVSRVVVVLSWAYLAWWKRNITVGIISHCLLNFIGTLVLFAGIFR